MDQILACLQPARESILRFLGLEETVSEVWLWASLGGCLFLLLYLSVWFLVRKRRTKRPHPDDSPSRGLGEAEGGSVPPAAEEAPENLLERLRGRLAKTHDQLIGRLDQIFVGSGAAERDLLEDLEEVLVTADLGVKTSYALLGEVQKEFDKKPLEPVELKAALRQKIGSMLDIRAPAFDPEQGKPFVIMVVGVNGVGKTTSIGKLASLLKGHDRKVMLVAADTFRTAAIEQLQIWSERAGTDFVKHKPGSDPSAVVYDALQAARSRDTDLVIVDTAGRLHTKANLMEELKKVKRIMSRELEGAPHEVLLVVDASTGQNAINQARTFHEALGVTGIILTKLDGTAKGGVIVGIANELQLPVRFIGIGERVEDLREFDADLFLEAIFGEPEKGWVH
jgi:fused signal recognition particle receptor